MRFRMDARITSLLTYLAILLFNAYALILYLEGQLTFYIHPRYVVFTVAFNAASALACGAGFAWTAWRMATGTAVASRVPWRPSLTISMAGLVLVAAYALPARTLSSETADQRSANFNSVQAGPAGSPGDTLDLFAADTSRLTVAEWASAFNLRPDPDSYVGKEVDVVGFVFHPEDAPADVFYVSRFSVTCCAVDARPFGLPVYSPGWREEFEEDSWVRVTGSFSETEEDIAEPAVVAPEGIEPTEQPENPYVN